MSTKAIKVLTTVCMVLCASMLVLWPAFVGSRPGKGASIALNKAFALKFAGYIGLMVLFLVLAGIGALWILRRVSAEFRAQQIENMKELVEATLEDHRKKASEQPKLD